jgi:hypothetical protein
LILVVQDRRSCPSLLTLVLNLSIRSKVKFEIKVKSDGQECPSYTVKIERQNKSPA